MATRSAGIGAVGTVDTVVWEDAQGAAAVFIMNGGSSGNVLVHVDGLHASGEYIQLGPVGFGSQLEQHAIFTLRPRGIKKIIARHASGVATVYYQTMET